ncbi:hypothetical protein B2J88_50115 [Rhodococcus sp. SRB_17]|nr:hypothetical protein [Rhodococcus sp. SRB_17]
MERLAEHLISKIPSQLSDASLSTTTWDLVAKHLSAGMNLEEALDLIAVNDPILPHIVTATAEIITTSESEALNSLLRSTEASALQKLLVYFSRTSAAPNIITTNYDRLIEFSSELSNIPVDSGFSGHQAAIFDESASSDELLVPSRGGRRGAILSNNRRSHIRLAKPHGSLDWFSLRGEPRRSNLNLSENRLMITPGQSKYVNAHEPPFDAHMQRAKIAIDTATSIIFIGYGFNDTHLQTHLPSRFRAGIPITILAKELSPSAHKYIGDHPHILALEEDKNSNESTLVHTAGTKVTIDNISLWSIDHIMSEVLA